MIILIILKKNAKDKKVQKPMLQLLMEKLIDFKLKSKAEKLEIKRDQEFYTLDFHPNKKKSKK